MEPVGELRAVTYKHTYVSTKRLTWATMAITATMGLLYFVVGFPPAFDSFHEKIYFHSIGIGLLALAAYLIVGAFDLERHEPPLDFPISYRAFGAVVLAALGGLGFLTPSTSRALPHVGMVLFISAFILITDVVGAILVELIVLPRKLAGTYRAQSHNPIQYVARLLPLSRSDIRAYRTRGLGYWLTLCAVASVFVAELIGFLNLWVMELGPSIFGRYIAWLGLDRKGYLDATLDPHSHMIAIAIMAGIVGVSSVLFRLAEVRSRASRIVSRIGLGITIVGIIGTTFVLGAVAFFNWAPPTLFQSGRGGVNGMPGDDATMAVVLFGALVVAAGILSDRSARHDAVRSLFAATWAAVVGINLVEGVYIEMHETLFQGSAAAKDAAFSTAHPLTGIFLTTTIALGLLLVGYYAISGRLRTVAAWAFGLGLTGAVLGSTLWTFTDPSKTGGPFWIYIAGTVISYAAILVTAFAVRRARVTSYERFVNVPEEPTPAPRRRLVSIDGDGARAAVPAGVGDTRR